MAVNVVMPQLGESVVEGTITKWLVKEGDVVTKDQPIVEVATDKADSEVPSPTAGTIVKILAAEGQTVPTNSQIAVIEAGAGKAASPVASTAPAPTASVAPAPAPAPASAARDGDAGPGGPQSPAVRKKASELGVDLSQVTGTGENGRVTKQDVMRRATEVSTAPAPAVAAVSAVPAVSAAPAAVRTADVSLVSSTPAPAAARATAPAAPGAFRVPPYQPQAGDEIVPFNRRRRIIADHMVYSKHVAPHVMTIAEIDMHKTHRLREAKKGALKADGVNLTYLAFIAAATARALRENPLVNARVLDDAYVKLKHVNLGIAVETPEGLLVPVIRDADDLTVKGLARAIDQMAVKARDGKITADDLGGATFTISNPGLKGNFVGAAIISQPNVGILRIGELVKRPVVIEVDGQDTIAIHPVMFAALSYDHRIVDGVAANGFLYRITELLEAGQFDL